MRFALPIAAPLCALALLGSANAQESTPTTAPQMTRADVEAWLDGFMPYALHRGDIAGAIVVVVKDGQPLLEKGYGFSDVAKRTPVDPDRTLFRPGSVSKLFTWTAVMQQVERGKLDLDADINDYLDFQIPPGPDGKPITLRNVMTHTPGFEEAFKELIVTDPAKVPTLEAVVKRNVPARIYAAGSTPAYSNYASTLAGYIIERVSGIQYDDYIEQNVFAPLGIKNGSFRQPLPAAMQANMSSGYELGSGDPEAYELITMPPAGSLAITGADMGSFMIAHLQNGVYRDARILSEETAHLMHDTPLTMLPPLNRMLLGFYESNTNGHRVISHGGDTQYFHSDLHLFVDDGVGIFISMNSVGKEGAAGPIRSAFFQEFADRYLPGAAPTGEMDAATAVEHAGLMSGSWVISRRPDTNLVSLVNLFTPVKMTANPDGTISSALLRGLNDQPRKWKEISPFVWVDVGGKTRLAAKVVDGKPVRFSFDDWSPFMVFERAPLAKSGAWLVPAAGASLVALALTVLLWPIAALVRRHYRVPFPLSGREARAHRWLRIGALASLLATAAWAGIVFAMLSDLAIMTTGFDIWLRILHVVGSLAVFAGFALALWNLSVVWKAKRRWLAKIWGIVLVLATLVCAWLAVAYHLVGFSVNY